MTREEKFEEDFLWVYPRMVALIQDFTIDQTEEVFRRILSEFKSIPKINDLIPKGLVLGENLFKSPDFNQ